MGIDNRALRATGSFGARYVQRLEILIMRSLVAKPRQHAVSSLGFIQDFMII